MTNNTKTLIFTAAVAGLFGGASSLHAQLVPQTSSSTNLTSSAIAGVLAHGTQTYMDAKHSCKGKNDCKGQGGCKSSDNGCKGKNSCKGKGGCATDGSKMP